MKVNTIEKFIEKAYTGGTILQIDAPGKFMFTIYKHFEKEVIVCKYYTEKRLQAVKTNVDVYVRWLWFEIDYSIKAY